MKHNQFVGRRQGGQTGVNTQVRGGSVIEEVGWGSEAPKRDTARVWSALSSLAAGMQPQGGGFQTWLG